MKKLYAARPDKFHEPVLSKKYNLNQTFANISMDSKFLIKENPVTHKNPLISGSMGKFSKIKPAYNHKNKMKEFTPVRQ